ncbi:hypothetical protein AMK27_36250 [Streptomyces sp. CB02009]|nr:hypothetical protein AMK27_36250 [Streptomyces sp. CB02009]
MDTSQSVSSAESQASGRFGWCAWHQGYMHNVRLIDVIEQGSGALAAGSFYACHSCRLAYDLTPLSAVG